MARVRVSELAKEYGVTSKEVLEKLTEMGEFVKAASSAVEPPVKMRFDQTYGDELRAKGEAAAAKKAAKKAPAKKAAEAEAPAASETAAEPAARPQRRPPSARRTEARSACAEGRADARARDRGARSGGRSRAGTGRRGACSRGTRGPGRARRLRRWRACSQAGPAPGRAPPRQQPLRLLAGHGPSSGPASRRPHARAPRRPVAVPTSSVRRVPPRVVTVLVRPVAPACRARTPR